MQTPRFANPHTSAHALGLACDETHVYYASMAAAPNACKALWASLVDNQGRCYCSPWATRNLTGKENLKSLYQSLPNTHYTHLVVLARHPELLLITEASAANLVDDAQRQARLADHWSDLPGGHWARFVSLLNAHTNTPALSDWASDLWEVGLAHGAITPLQAFGDCLGAWWIDLDFDWTALAADLLTRAVLTL